VPHEHSSATKVAELKSTASGADGDVEVTVGGTGQLIDLSLAEGTADCPPQSCAGSSSIRCANTLTAPDPVSATPSEIASHAGTVRDIADEVRVARDAGNQVALGRDACGILCQAIPTLLEPIQGAMLDALARTKFRPAATSLTRTHR
jgi:hypothetical protein